MRKNRVSLALAAMSFSCGLYGQYASLPGLYNSNNGVGNVVFPGSITGFGGDYTTISVTGTGFLSVTPSSSNPTPSTLGVQTWAVTGFQGLQLSLSAQDHDTGASINANLVTVGPGSFFTGQAVTTDDPISSATGELVQPHVPDLSLGGPLPLSFQRYYASLMNANGVASRLGNNWMHNFEWVLVQGAPWIEVNRPGAKAVLFQQSGSGWQLATTERVNYQLISGMNGTFQFLDPAENLIYTFSGTASTLGLSAIQDRNGNKLTVTSTATSAQVSDGLGRMLNFTYNANGQLVTVADQTGRSVGFGYTGTDLTSFTDANGNMETFAYTTTPTMNGLMTAETLPLGNKPFTQTWTMLGQVASQSDSRGNTTDLTYNVVNTSSVSTTIKDPLGVSMNHTSRLFSDFTGLTDASGNKLSVTYDASGHRNSVSDRLGNTISMKFDSASGYLASATDALGNTTTYTWQPQTSGGFTFYVLGKIAYADGTSASCTYDANGNLLTLTDQAGKTSSYTYNTRGQVVTATDPDGHMVKYSYNSADGTLASMTDAAGNVTTYGYDALKRANLVTYADGSTQSTTYDNLDHVVKEVAPNGNITTYTYNNNEKVASVTHGSGAASTVAYDTDEQVSKTTDSAGNSTSYTYNALDLNDSVTTPAGEKYTFAYDSQHRLSGVFDPSGKGSMFAYDKEDGPASVTDALSRKTSYTTDAFGAVTQVTTPLGENYLTTFDKLHRVTAVMDPAGIGTKRTLDARGLTTALSVGNLTSMYTRDAAGLLTGITDPNGNSWSRSLDSAGRAVTFTDPLMRATSYSYDKLNRLSGVQWPLGSETLTRDKSGNILQRMFSDSTVLNYTYSPLNQLTGGTGMAFSYNADHQMVGSNGLGMSYDADGRLGSITYATGKTVTYGYNAVGELATVTDWVSGATTFSYDAAHELIAVKRPNGLGTQYTYDGDGRVGSITEDAGSSIVIQRDGAGKTVSETRTQPQMPALAPGILPLAFDAADQVSGFTYDSMGRLTADTFGQYTWNLASQLSSYTRADGAGTATYDGLGLRISESTAAGVQNFVWNYATGLPTLATVQSGGVDQRYYVYTPDGVLLYEINAVTNARTYHHFDENGNATLLTNDVGAVTDSYGITPYGETVTQKGTTVNPFTWLGQWGAMQEGSTSLYYIRDRYYDSATGRFLSPDPVKGTGPQSVNPYQYALGSPLEFVDPTGRDPQHPGMKRVSPFEWDYQFLHLSIRGRLSWEHELMFGEYGAFEQDAPTVQDTSAAPDVTDLSGASLVDPFAGVDPPAGPYFDYDAAFKLLRKHELGDPWPIALGEDWNTGLIHLSVRSAWVPDVLTAASGAESSSGSISGIARERRATYVRECHIGCDHPFEPLPPATGGAIGVGPGSLIPQIDRLVGRFLPPITWHVKPGELSGANGYTKRLGWAIDPGVKLPEANTFR
jgi:RHS repeat-associated protein